MRDATILGAKAAGTAWWAALTADATGARPLACGNARVLTVAVKPGLALSPRKHPQGLGWQTESANILANICPPAAPRGRGFFVMDQPHGALPAAGIECPRLHHLLLRNCLNKNANQRC